MLLEYGDTFPQVPVWLQSSRQPGGSGRRFRRGLAAQVAEFAANNAADAAGRGDLVAEFAATGGTGRRVRRGLVTWSQSSPGPCCKVAGGSRRVNGNVNA